ncbi:DUF7713 domain-containing protein [Paraburkholderia sp. EB58]|jgi:hypothetical protein
MSGMELKTVAYPVSSSTVGRVEWHDLSAILMAFQGRQFRLELLDPTDEV